mgnify:CR=1 FL=1
MKKKVLFLLPLFLGACSDSGESPVITIEKLYVKVDQGDGETIREDYANRMSEMPALKVGDKVDAFLILDGNGASERTAQGTFGTIWKERQYQLGDSYTQ